MKRKKEIQKFLLLTALLIISRLCDIITTYIYIPNLQSELNPIVSIFGQNWTAMLAVQVIVISGIIYCIWVYCTKEPVLPQVNQPLTLKEFISLFNFNDTKSFFKLFYKIPKNKNAALYTIGYCFTISLSILSLLVASSTTLLIVNDTYKYFYRAYNVPYILVFSFIPIFLIVSSKFYKKEYTKWQLRQPIKGMDAV
jgi:hypothetical protein